MPPTKVSLIVQPGDSFFPIVNALDKAQTSVNITVFRMDDPIIQQAMSGRTTLVVSNRVSTLRRADRILVLQQGRITAEGPHAELLEKSGYYRHLAELQFVETASSAGPA